MTVARRGIEVTDHQHGAGGHVGAPHVHGAPGDAAAGAHRT